MDLYEQDENLKARKKEQAKRLPRKAAGVAYGNMMADLLCSFKALNIPIDESTLYEDYVQLCMFMTKTVKNFYMRFWMTSLRCWKVYKQQWIRKMKTYTLGRILRT